MSEDRVPIRQPRLHGPGSSSGLEMRAVDQHVRSATELIEEKLRSGLEHADELAAEFGEITLDERRKLLEVWPAD